MRGSGTALLKELAASAMLLCAIPAWAGEVPVVGVGGTSYGISVKSMQELKFDGIVKQQYDFSCGSAALATLLSYHYNVPSGENDLIASMYAIGDQQKIQREGFSMLDMRNYLQSVGLSSNGYKVTLDQLQQVGIPAIVLVNNNGYLHFVVIKGITEKHVLVGDPALGMKILERPAFEQTWNGIVFVVDGSMQTAKTNFNKQVDWKVSHRFPLNQVLDSATLAGFTVDTMYSQFYY